MRPQLARRLNSPNLLHCILTNLGRHLINSSGIGRSCSSKPAGWLGILPSQKETHVKTHGRQRAFRVATKYAFGIVLLAVTSGLTYAQTNTFPSSGNAGVGTTSPLTKVHAMSGSTSTQAVIATTDSSGNSGSGVALYSGWSGGSPNPPALIWTAGRDLRFGGGITDLNTGAGFAETMRITSSGRVGIGTTTPDIWAKLHVFNADGAGIDVQSTTAGMWSRIRLVTGTHIYGWFAGDSTQGDAPNKIGLYDYTLSAFRMMVDSSGNIGFGTSSPALQTGVSNRIVEVQGTINPGIALTATGSGGRQFFLYSSQTNPGYFSVFDGTAGADRLTISSTGNVGLGTASPIERLHVSGNGKITGNLTVDGNIAAKYQDVAEWVPASEKLEAGTVVVLDSTRSNQVTSSSEAYDTRVAGVVSEQPGIALGQGGEGKVLVATTGRLRVKVDATRAPIQIGDLLVTSDTPGVAMKSEPIVINGRRIHSPGTLIGKALEPLANGKGEILVLLSLQ